MSTFYAIGCVVYGIRNYIPSLLMVRNGNIAAELVRSSESLALRTGAMHNDGDAFHIYVYKHYIYTNHGLQVPRHGISCFRPDV